MPCQSDAFSDITESCVAIWLDPDDLRSSPLHILDCRTDSMRKVLSFTGEVENNGTLHDRNERIVTTGLIQPILKRVVVWVDANDDQYKFELRHS